MKILNIEITKWDYIFIPVMIILFCHLFINPVHAAWNHQIYNGSYSDQYIENITYNPITGDYDIRFDGGMIRMKNWTGENVPIDHILNPDTLESLSNDSGWYAESYKNNWKLVKTQSVSITHNIINKSIIRYMETEDGGMLNVTYQLEGGKLKFIVNRTAGNEGTIQRVVYYVKIVNGKGKLLPNSKKFNPELSETISMMWDYSDIPEENYSVSQYIDNGGKRYNLAVVLNNGTIMANGQADGFDPAWVADSAIVSGLPDVGLYSTPSAAFVIDDIRYMLAGESSYVGVVNGFDWTGSTWQADSQIPLGATYYGGYTTPTIFTYDSTLWQIGTIYNPSYYAWYWNTSLTTWSPNSSMSDGFYRESDGTYNWPYITAFTLDSNLYAIMGNLSGAFRGFSWNGSGWDINDSVISGLPIIASGYATPTVFNNGGITYLISGNHLGTFEGFNWTGSAWQSDTALVEGLTDVSDHSTPTTFVDGSTLYLISGSIYGEFIGWNTIYTSGEPQPNITSWSNDYTSNNTLSFTVPYNTNVTFNITSNQTLDTCSWVGATEMNCTADSYAYKVFNTVGTKYVSFSGSNVNGTTLNSVNWTVEVVDSYNITECRYLTTDGGYYRLQNDVFSIGTCLITSANNITIDGQYHLVNFSASITGYGVYNNGYSNVTTKNLNITTVSTSSSTYSIYYNDTNAEFGNITDNIITATSGIGIYLDGSPNNDFTNNTITVTDGYGIYLYLSPNNDLTDNTAESTGGVGIYLDGSSGVVLTNNTATSTSGYGIYLKASSNNNTLTNNTATATSGYGIILSVSEDNIISGGSILSSIGSSYYLDSSFNNTFSDTNFTTREISFGDTVSWFNYSNNSGLTFVSNNVSEIKIIEKTLHNWNQTNITFSEDVTVTNATSYYNVTGLLPSVNYNIYIDSILTYSKVSDPDGTIGIFSVSLTTTPQTIGILQVTVDTSFTLSLPAGQTQAFFNATNKSSTNVTASGQNTTSGFLYITNTGNVYLDFYAIINTTQPTGVVLKYDTDNDPTGATTLDTSLTQIVALLGESSSQNIWLWVDYSNVLPMSSQRNLSVNSSQS